MLLLIECVRICISTTVPLIAAITVATSAKLIVERYYTVKKQQQIWALTSGKLLVLIAVVCALGGLYAIYDWVRLKRISQRLSQTEGPAVDDTDERFLPAEERQLNPNQNKASYREAAVAAPSDQRRPILRDQGTSPMTIRRREPGFNDTHRHVGSLASQLGITNEPASRAYQPGNPNSIRRDTDQLGASAAGTQYFSDASLSLPEYGDEVLMERFDEQPEY